MLPGLPKLCSQGFRLFLGHVQLYDQFSVAFLLPPELRLDLTLSAAVFYDFQRLAELLHLLISREEVAAQLLEVGRAALARGAGLSFLPFHGIPELLNLLLFGCQLTPHLLKLPGRPAARHAHDSGRSTKLMLRLRQAPLEFVEAAVLVVAFRRLPRRRTNLTP